MRLVPKARTPKPIVNGVQGDFAMRKEATVGAMIAATTLATLPSRKELALN